jgi:hypothetical protein
MDEEEEAWKLTTTRPNDNQKLLKRQTRDGTDKSCIDQEFKSEDTYYPDRDLKYYRNTSNAILGILGMSQVGSESY